MFDDPFDIDCSECKADLDECCVDADGNTMHTFHVERLNAIVLWNRFIKTGDFDIAIAAQDGDES